MSERAKVPELFYESYTAALRDDCRAIEPSRAWGKVVGTMLYPEKDPEAAARTLDDDLNSSRRARLSDEQERLIMRKAREVRGYSAALNFICDETGFDRPTAKNPRDEALELQTRSERLVAELKQLLERQERLTRTPLQSISSDRKAG
jgi:hypothetical protein